MFGDVASDSLGQPHRHGVADLPGNGTETPGELEVHRECLKASRFPDADRTILLGVPEAAVGVADASGSQPGSGTVPRHAAVDIAVSCGVFVAFQPEFVRPVPVAAALRSCADTLQIECRKACSSVVGDRGVRISGRDLRKVSDPVAHRIVVGIASARAVGVGREFEGPEATGEQEESAAPLRHSVPHQGHRSECRLGIASLLQALKKLAERLGVRAHILDPRDILDKYDVRLAPLDEAKEIEKQRHPVVLVPFGADGVVLREGLAGRASAEQNRIGPLLGHEFVDDVVARVPDVRGLERGCREVQPEGLPGVGIPVEGEHHVHSSVLEAAAGSPAAREEVEHFHSGAGSGFAVRFVFGAWVHGRGGAVAGWIVKHSHNVKGTGPDRAQAGRSAGRGG